jgi:hypothetical protein
MAAVLALLPGRLPARGPAKASRPALAGALETGAVALKASGGIAAPFMLIGAPDRRRLVTGAVAAFVAAAAASTAVFGTKALEAFALIGQNQERTTRWSLPQRAADGIASLTSGSASSIVHFTRALFVAALAVAVVLLARWAWERRDDPRAWVVAAGWATLGVLLATAWLVPWYAIWLVPLAAIAGSRRLLAATVVLCAYMLVIAVPL